MAYSKQSHATKSFKGIKANNTQALLQEIQDLELEILDMFEVAFHFAGLMQEHLQEALEYYTTLIESYDDKVEYNAQSIIQVITQIQCDKPQWFKL